MCIFNKYKYIYINIIYKHLKFYYKNMMLFHSLYKFPLYNANKN